MQKAKRSLPVLVSDHEAINVVNTAFERWLEALEKANYSYNSLPLNSHTLKWTAIENQYDSPVAETSLKHIWKIEYSEYYYPHTFATLWMQNDEEDAQITIASTPPHLHIQIN